MARLVLVVLVLVLVLVVLVLVLLLLLLLLRVVMLLLSVVAGGMAGAPVVATVVAPIGAGGIKHPLQLCRRPSVLHQIKCARSIARLVWSRASFAHASWGAVGGRIRMRPARKVTAQ